MKSVSISPDLSVSYRQLGEDGPPLVFLHAFPLSSEMWIAQIDEFANGYQVFAPDLRGIGKTSHFDGTPSIATLASDLAGWLDAMEIIEPIILCGLSLGGYVALEFARTYPGKLRALILADTRAVADSSEGRAARDEMVAFASGNSGMAVAEKMLSKLIGETSLHSRPGIVLEVQEIAAPNSGDNLAHLTLAMRDRRDSTEILPQITCPTLVIGGSEDVVSPPAEMAELAVQIPGARHVMIDGAGHLSNLERPDVFNRELHQFLSGLG